MKFVQFCYKSRSHSALGIMLEECGEIVDLVELGVNNLVDFLKGGEELRAKAEK